MIVILSDLQVLGGLVMPVPLLGWASFHAE